MALLTRHSESLIGTIGISAPPSLNLFEWGPTHRAIGAQCPLVSLMTIPSANSSTFRSPHRGFRVISVDERGVHDPPLLLQWGRVKFLLTDSCPVCQRAEAHEHIKVVAVILTVGPRSATLRFSVPMTLSSTPPNLSQEFGAEVAVRS